MADREELHLVFGAGILLGAYWRTDSAHLHARCVTGATVLGPVTVRDHVPPEVLEDLESDEWDGGDTPVADPPTGMLASFDGSSSGADAVPPRPRGARPPGDDR